MKDLKLSILQSELFWEDVEANLAMFEEQIWDIEEADIILLPEMFNTGFSMNPERLAEVPGLKTQKWLLQMAEQKNAMVAGSYIVNDKGSYYNRFVAAFPNGTIQYYDKKHLFTLANEENHFEAGTERLIFEFRGWKVCPMICYDLRFPAWARNTISSNSEYEYDLLLFTASWPKPRINAWDTLLQARAIENLAFVAGANRMGRDGNDYEYVGHSAIYDFQGKKLDKLENEIGIVQATLRKDELDIFRNRFPFLSDAHSFEFV